MTNYTYNLFEKYFLVGQGVGLLLVISLTLLISITVVGIQQAESITQFYFDLPDKFKIANGTVFRAAYYDDDGEGTYFIWNFTNLKSNPYDFSIRADLIPYEEKHSQTRSVELQTEVVQERNYYKFAINENITIGSNFELCIQSSTVYHCEWPLPVDNFGRVLGDFTSKGRLN